MVTVELSIIPSDEDKINYGPPACKVKRPWEYPMIPTPDMITLANKIIRCIKETNKFILELEGPTDEQVD